MRKPRNEHMSAGLPLIADIAQRGWHGATIGQDRALIVECTVQPFFARVLRAQEMFGVLN
jgi:hypothetical protein